MHRIIIDQLIFKKFVIFEGIISLLCSAMLYTGDIKSLIYYLDNIPNDVKQLSHRIFDSLFGKIEKLFLPNSLKIIDMIYSYFGNVALSLDTISLILNILDLRYQQFKIIIDIERYFGIEDQYNDDLGKEKND